MTAEVKKKQKFQVIRRPKSLVERDRLINVAITNALAASHQDDEVPTQILIAHLNHVPHPVHAATVNRLLHVELYDAIGLFAVSCYPWAFIEMNAALRRIAVEFYVKGLDEADETAIRAAPMKTLGHLFKRAKWWTASDLRFALNVEATAGAVAKHDFAELQKYVRRKTSDSTPAAVYPDFNFQMETTAAALARTLSLCVKVVHPPKG